MSRNGRSLSAIVAATVLVLSVATACGGGSSPVPSGPTSTVLEVAAMQGILGG